MNSSDFWYERRLWRRGFKIIAGVDEVGRGCFAGPVVASAVAFAPNSNFQFPIFSEKGERVRIDDSKKLTSKQREIAAGWIRKNAYAYGVGSASAKLINRLGMAKATQMAFRRAVSSAGLKISTKKKTLPARNTAKSPRIEFLLIDAFFIPYVKGLPRGTKKIKGDGKLTGRVSRQLAIVNGDEKSFSIAAASIVAKVYRDKLMLSLSNKSKYKKYGWGRNKGYATKEHTEAILKYGITGYHRKKFVETYLQRIKFG